jgi:hypothetical protein
VLYEHAQLPHNIFVQVGADLGYIGLFVYAMLIMHCFIRKKTIPSKFRAPNDFMAVLPSTFNVAIIGFFVAGQFVSVVYYPFMWIHLALVVALVNIMKTSKEDVSGKSEHNTSNMSARLVGTRIG